MNLENVLEFTKFLNKFHEIERTVYATKTRQENDSEHSFQLAMLSWFMNDSASLNLDTSLLIKYALIHDLVEVYAGDTYFYSTENNHQEIKHDKEEIARLQIQKEFPSFIQLHSYIEEYEKGDNRESNFIYVLDKIHPVIMIYLNEGREWKHWNVTLEMLLSKKKDKIHLAPELMPIWDELEKILIEKQDQLFPKLTLE
jgi:putative hydrolase of HD superfamily